MKRGIALFLVFLMMLGLCACGSDKLTEVGGAGEKKKTKTMELKKVLVDTSDAYLSLDSVEKNGDDISDAVFTVKNRTDHLCCLYVMTNDGMEREAVYLGDVPAGESVTFYAPYNCSYGMLFVSNLCLADPATEKLSGKGPKGDYYEMETYFNISLSTDGKEVFSNETTMRAGYYR